MVRVRGALSYTAGAVLGTTFCFLLARLGVLMMPWALVAGAPGAIAHRVINTMDSMVGHRDTRYAEYGWAAARLDDPRAPSSEVQLLEELR